MAAILDTVSSFNLNFNPASLLKFAGISGGLFNFGASQLPFDAVSQTQWDALNSTVGGRLRVGIPFSHPCFSKVEFGDGFNASKSLTDEEKCKEIQTKHEDHVFRAEHFGSYELTQWETCQTSNENCLLDWTNHSNPSAFAEPKQCQQGSVPRRYIEVAGPEDVTAAYDFTKKSGIPLVIKNSGHDYIGRSSGKGSLALWTRGLNKLELNKEFVPEGCSEDIKAQAALTIGAGRDFRTILDFAKENNITFVAGADPSVGASGGWVMGGGHSGLSPSLGLGVDRVLEFKIVTPDGVYRTVNKCQGQDLFWALRGGGGGTFGVVLESSFIIEPEPLTFQIVLGQYEPTKENSRKLIKELTKSAVQMASEGWGGYVTPALSSAVWLNHNFDPSLASPPFGTPEQAPEAVRASVQGVIDAFAAVGGNTVFFTMHSFTDIFDTFIAPNPDQVGRPQIMATRLFPASTFSGPDRDEVLIDAMIDGMLESDFGQILSVAPYSYKGHEHDEVGTSINPKWREAVWHTLMSYNWNFDSSLAEKIAIHQKLTEKWSVVRERTPGAGVYFNEADVYEPDWQTTFWGPNYERLLEVKKKYDPGHILDCWRCVGWKGAKDPLYKCYPDAE